MIEVFCQEHSSTIPRRKPLMLHTAVIVLKIIFGIVVLFPVVCYALGLYWGMGHRTRAYIFKDDSGSRLIAFLR